MSPLSPRHHNPYALRTIVLGTLTALLTACFCAYAIYQARFLIAGPQIALSDTATTVSHERVVTISGVASNITHLTLNGRPIFTDQSGHFDETVVLENGYTAATIRAEDRYGRTLSIERSFVFAGLPAEETIALGTAHY